MLGYGGSSKPEEAQKYTTKKLCEDLVALLDLLGIRKAVVIGHDWGSYTAGRFALWHPERLHALIMLSVPYTPPSQEYLPLTEVVKRAPNLGYQLYFSEKRSSQEILAHLPKFIGLVFGPPTKKELDFTPTGRLEKLLPDPSIPDDLPTCLTDKERQYYLQQLGQDMNGPLNYYRTSQLRHEEELAAGLKAKLPEDLPYLFLWGTSDPTVTSFVIAKARKFIQRYQDIAIEGKGHWLMVEAKDDVTDQVMTWLEGLMGSHSPRKPRL
ncbi:hypothetical protein CC2G_010143 [Coprinopsis cinerea AmutBmut pab1-1]|nr:hypothetical protein CC2G_010143 [Coprinopsis cinerea AmutBmut pab1-1]